MSLFVEKQSRRVWTLQGGWQTVRTWHGPQTDVAEFEATELPTGYVSLNIETELDGWTTYEAAFASSTQLPDEQPPADFGLIARTWTLDANEIEEPMLTHPAIGGGKTGTVGLGDIDPLWPTRLVVAAEAYRQDLAAAASRGDEAPDAKIYHDPQIPALAGVVDKATMDALLDVSWSFFKMLTRDPNPAWAFSQYVLRKTETVTPASVLLAGHAGVGRFMTYTTLTTSEPSLPSAVLIDSQGIGPTGTNLYWLKKSPQVQQVSNGQFQIVQEYWGAERFESWLYGPAL